MNSGTRQSERMNPLNLGQSYHLTYFIMNLSMYLFPFQNDKQNMKSTVHFSMNTAISAYPLRILMLSPQCGF